MLLLMASQLASAQPRDAGRVAAGEDLAAWRDLLEQRGPEQAGLDDVDALFAFLREFPSSPLSELAYRRLVELGHDVPVDLRGTVARIADSYREHEAVLLGETPSASVRTLSAPIEVESHTTLEHDEGISWLVEAGAGLSEGPAVYVGAGWELGPVALTARGVMERDAHLGAAVKLMPWQAAWRPFAELGYLGPTPNGELVAGVRGRLLDGYYVEAAAGVNRDLDVGTMTPALRMGLVVAF